MKDLMFRLAFLSFVFIIFPLLLIYITAGHRENTYADIAVFDVEKNKIYKLDREEYITRVVAAEMPAGFETEALKAQAVAARTYSFKKMNTDDDKHFGADLCTDFNHCQAYCSPDAMKEKWGNKFKDNYNKIHNAVLTTDGEYLKYGEDIALAVFHACSNGKTENARDVWGGDIPYLISVESIGDDAKSDYISENIYSKKEFLKLLNKWNESEIIEKSDEKLIEDIVLSEGDNVDHIIINGKKIKGVDIRKIFNLKSTSFTIEESETEIKFIVCGHGHGVGMSQYGANDMAKKSKNYKEILSHYYPGTQIEKMYK